MYCSHINTVIAWHVCVCCCHPLLPRICTSELCVVRPVLPTADRDSQLPPTAGLVLLEREDLGLPLPPHMVLGEGTLSAVHSYLARLVSHCWHLPPAGVEMTGKMGFPWQKMFNFKWRDSDLEVGLLELRAWFRKWPKPSDRFLLVTPPLCPWALTDLHGAGSSELGLLLVLG